jgi:hypothetical protein
MSDLYFWSKLYTSAVLETDLRKLPLRIREAEWAIRERLSSTMPIDLAERQIIVGARVRLKELHSERIAKAIVKEITGRPLLLAFVDLLRKFAKLLDLFVARLHL